MAKPKISKNPTSHQEQIANLKRIEGQIRGVLKMVEEERYCVDILTQLHAIGGAIENVENQILQKHLEGCVVKSLKRSDSADTSIKIREILEIINKFRR